MRKFVIFLIICPITIDQVSSGSIKSRIRDRVFRKRPNRPFSFRQATKKGAKDEDGKKALGAEFNPRLLPELSSSFSSLLRGAALVANFPANTTVRQALDGAVERKIDPTPGSVGESEVNLCQLGVSPENQWCSLEISGRRRCCQDGLVCDIVRENERDCDMGLFC